MPEMPYYLGAPVWACDGWVGSLYSNTNRRRWLGEYSAVFNTVEGNSTFYGLPDADTFCRWADETHDDFRFLLKFPSAITHERELVGAERETEEFVDRLRILQQADRLGPSLLQLAPYFAGDQLPNLEAFLRKLPKDISYAVEVRHADYFDAGRNEKRLDQLLAELKVDRALFDSRPLFSASPTDESEQKSQSRKPRSPFRTTVTGDRPVVRFIGRNQLSRVDPWIREWVDVVAAWIEEGKTPYVFTHAPDDAHAVEFAERFHAAMMKRLPSLAPLPQWPGRQALRQRSLF